MDPYFYIHSKPNQKLDDYTIVKVFDYLNPVVKCCVASRLNRKFSLYYSTLRRSCNTELKKAIERISEFILKRQIFKSTDDVLLCRFVHWMQRMNGEYKTRLTYVLDREKPQSFMKMKRSSFEIIDLIKIPKQPLRIVTVCHASLDPILFIAMKTLTIVLHRKTKISEKMPKPDPSLH